MKHLVTIFAFLLLPAGALAAVHLGGEHRSTKLSRFSEILDRSRAKYAGLKAYADTGTVMTEYKGSGDPGPATVESHSFKTYYRSPRQFFFEFVKDPNVGEERFVIWADGADFYTWWSATKVRDNYPKGQGGTAFALATFPTKGSLMQIAPLLFAEGGLHGPIVDIKVLRSDETEEINKHRCYKVVGEVALAYGTGAVTSVRATTVWIDAETLLVRKILEETPKNGAGIDRITTTFEPVADPKIDDARFKFDPAAGDKSST
jgi:outer membrane lipoprotein-sorting protein